MAGDPYQILGVAKGSTPEQIRRAYRRLAKKHHPDVNPGDKGAEEKFKQVSVAHDILSDRTKRARYDRGEIDGSGQERTPERPRPGPQYASGFAGAQQGGRARHPAGEAGLGDIFSEFFRNQAGMPGGQERPAMRGQDEQYSLTVDFIDSVLGGSRVVTLAGGRTVEITIPTGLQDGQTLRLRGQGSAGWNGEGPGDALVEIAVAPHPFFRRDGDDIHLDLPVTIAEAVLGARVTVPTPAGPVKMTVPPKSDAGRQLRLRGRGVAAHAGRPAGDLYASLRLVLGGTVDEPLEAALRAWKTRSPVDPRAAMTGLIKTDD